MPSPSAAIWPELEYGAWNETRATLHLWTQVAGKIRLALTPWLNHSWHVPLYVTSRGLTTSLIPHPSGAFEINFDFIEHALDIVVSVGTSRRIRLEPRAVAEFYAEVMAALAELAIPTAVNEQPCEITGAIPFSRDHAHAAYDPDYAQRFWRVLVQADRVFKQFRTGFIGKCSPVHFFWGSFDLAVTRFSGRRAPPFSGRTPGVPIEVMREAYSHEVSSAGFWPGGNGTEFAAFYSYAYPTPGRLQESARLPGGAYFSESLGEFLLPYDLVRQASDPDALLLAFLQSTYEAAAQSADWARAALECPQGLAGAPRETDATS
jgi:hypothetical protein